MRYRVAGISFEHMHMGDNLQMVAQHPDCEIVGICDSHPERMQDVIAAHGLPADQVFTDWQACIERSRPDFIVLCPATGDHALWVQRLAPWACPCCLRNRWQLRWLRPTR